MAPVPSFIAVDATSRQFPDAVRRRQAENFADPTTVEGEAVQAFVASKSPTASASESPAYSTLLPKFVKSTSNPLLTAAEQQGKTGLSTIYWPYCVLVRGRAQSPLGAYYLYWSTDHDNGSGGIAMAYADRPEGPWSVYGKVFTDTAAGAQTETPSVVWNEATNRFHMYYQQDGVGTSQATLLATSADGVQWTRTGTAILSPDPSVLPGNGHTGYFRPFRAGALWFAYSLFGGGNYPHFALWYSNDGINWRMDPRPLAYSVDVTGTNSRRVEWNSLNVFTYRGRLMALFSTKNFVSGANEGVIENYVAPLRPDLRGFAGTPVQVLGDQQPYESAVDQVDSVLVDAGKIYAFYRADGASGHLSTAIAGA